MMPTTMLPAERGKLEPLAEPHPLSYSSGKITADSDRTRPEDRLQLGWFDWLNRHRRLWFSIVAAFYVLSFNGLWRVGVDSALYRGLARSLVNGEGYVFAGEHHRHAYPGLPVMLAALDKVFGESPVPGLIVTTLMALATLWLIDRTIALRFPLWVATVVTIGVGLNFRMIRLTQQLMTDVPFTFGVVLAFYGLERLRLLAKGAGPIAFARWAAAMVAGLVIAASMRPTFAVLAGGVVIASAFRVVRASDNRRSLHASILCAALLVLLALFAFDPRTRSMRPWEGVYEQELIDRVGELRQTIFQSVKSLLGNDLNDVFFCQQLWPVSYLASLALLTGGVLVMRRNLAWGLAIFLLVAVTLPLSTVPRYFLMVAPFLWLGWILLWTNVTLKIPPDKQGPFLALILGFPLFVNVARSIDFIWEQQRPTIHWLAHGGSREDLFYQTYRDGAVLRLQKMAAMIHDHTSKAQTVIGPEAHVLAYLADRRVIGERTLFIDREAALSQWPQIVAKAKPDFAIFPASAYDDNDSMMRDLIRRRIVVAELTAAEAGDLFLASVSVRPPPPGVNWRNYKAPAESSTRSSNGHSAKRASVRRGSATQRADVIAARERREQREAKLRRAEKQAKLDRQAAQDRREKREKIERRQRAEQRASKQAKLERQQKIERKQRLERQKKQAKKKGAKHKPATTTTATTTHQ